MSESADGTQTLRKRIFDRLYPEEGTSWIDLGILALIIANVTATGLEYVPGLFERYRLTFVVFEWVSSIVFTIEYLVRMWVIVENPKYARPILGRIRYAFTPMALVDLVAVVPFYLPFLIDADLRAVRAIRLVRLVRLVAIAQQYRRHVYEILYPGEGTSGVDTFIILLITANVVAISLETEPYVHGEYGTLLLVFEWFSSIFFTLEYIVRLWVCVEDEQYAHPVWGRMRYAVSIMALIDLVAIVPFYLPFLIQTDLRIVRAIRMFRLLRLLKVGRYAFAVRTIAAVINRKREDMAICIFVMVLLTVICASLMYYVEHDGQPQAFRSIPASMWWTLVTMTSVGYGDVVPKSGLGQIIGSLICVLGVGMVALPTAVLSAGFNEHMREMKRGKDEELFGYCPHCGEQLLPGEELE